MKKEMFSDVLGDISEIHIKDALDYKSVKISSFRKWVTVAACMILLISLGFGSVAVIAEAKEYNAAVEFFNDYDMSTDGLTRGEIKAVYRDITTKSFTYSKTADVIKNSISSDRIDGYEILQNAPTSENTENLWNYKNSYAIFEEKKVDGVRYSYHSEYKTDPNLGFEVHDKSYIEKYDGEELLWSAFVSEFWINGYSVVSDGVIAYGNTPTWSSTQISNAWMVKVDSDGNVIWKHMLDNGFEDEYIAEILENDDGSLTVISRGDLKYFCFSRYTSAGNVTHFAKTEIGNYGIWNVARLSDGYIVQLGSYMTNEHSKIVKVDCDGNITEAFSYGDNESYYYITDMIEFNGNIYLSAYAVPRLEDEDQNAGGRYEIAAILNYLFDNNRFNISDKELTPMVRDNYTAMLLLCDSDSGEPQIFYSVKGSLGGELSLNGNGELIWDVQSITSTFFSPMTSAFTIGGTCFVYRYTFDDYGKLISREKTGETVGYSR